MYLLMHGTYMHTVFVDIMFGVSARDSKKGEVVFCVWANLLVRAFKMKVEG